MTNCVEIRLNAFWKVKQPVCLFVFFFSPLDFTKSRFVFFHVLLFFRYVFSLATELVLVDLCQCISFFGRCKFIAIDSNGEKDKTREYYIYLSFSFNYYIESKICVLNSQHQLLCAFFFTAAKSFLSINVIILLVCLTQRSTGERRLINLRLFQYMPIDKISEWNENKKQKGITKIANNSTQLQWNGMPWILMRFQWITFISIG